MIDDRMETGRWIFLTESGSQYEIDLDECLLKRVPGEGANSLRRDGEVLDLLEIITCHEGMLGEFMIQIRDDGVSTYRRTTTIIDIKEAQ